MTTDQSVNFFYAHELFRSFFIDGSNQDRILSFKYLSLSTAAEDDGIPRYFMVSFSSIGWDSWSALLLCGMHDVDK